MAIPSGSAQVRVKRCGKSAPATGVTRSARQTPPGARSNRGTDGPSGTPPGVPPPGGPLRWMATQPPQGGGQNPAYRPAHRHHLRAGVTEPLPHGLTHQNPQPRHRCCPVQGQPQHGANPQAAAQGAETSGRSNRHDSAEGRGVETIRQPQALREDRGWTRCRVGRLEEFEVPTRSGGSTDLSSRTGVEGYAVGYLIEGDEVLVSGDRRVCRPEVVADPMGTHQWDDKSTPSTQLKQLDQPWTDLAL